jgi:hypothetical protein
LLFSLLILELFLILSYFLINPLNRSLIIALAAYLLSGFCFTIIPDKKTNSFSTYVTLFWMMIAVLLLTSSWGS